MTAVLNIALLGVVLLVFARWQFRFDLGSFLLSSARERIVSVSRLAALQLPDTPQSEWTSLMARYSSRYPAQFYVFRQDGKQLAGQPITLPAAFLQEMQKDPFAHPPREPGPPLPDEHGVEPPGQPQADGHPPDRLHRGRRLSFFWHSGQPGSAGPVWGGPRHGALPDAPLDVLKTSNPAQYWVGVRIPIWNPEMEDPIHATLVWRFNSLWTEPFYFDPRPWLAVSGVVILISALCWVPLVQGLTRTISRVTAATRRIADGHFDIQLTAKRRDELGLLSESINRMAARLAGYVHGQKRFLGDIAHELSSPLARMQMALGILEQRSTEESAGYIADLREEVEHMSGLVSELLSFSKGAVSRTVTLQPVSVNETISRVMNREGSPDVSLTAHLAEGLTAEADPDYLARAVANVVRNAVRYAGEAGPIEIYGRREGDRVRITVADQGPGIAESELENIFRPFYRPEFARTRETGGTGLGLAIVRDCVEACGGRVECRNRSPHGLEVTLQLPAAGTRA